MDELRHIWPLIVVIFTAGGVMVMIRANKKDIAILFDKGNEMDKRLNGHDIKMAKMETKLDNIEKTSSETREMTIAILSEIRGNPKNTREGNGN